MNKEQLQAEINKHNWYHKINLGGIVTPGSPFDLSWDLTKRALRKVDFRGKAVLDIGCRDGMFSLEALERGAGFVHGVDNDLSPALTQVVMPYLNLENFSVSEKSIYELPDFGMGKFDIVLMLGILYHLRYPNLGLWRAVNCVKMGGDLVIETAVYVKGPKDVPLMFCPYKRGNPYEPGSITYFNDLGLIDTMESFGCSHQWTDTNEDYRLRDKGGLVQRKVFKFVRSGEMEPYLDQYWNGTHTCHTGKTMNEVAQVSRRVI